MSETTPLPLEIVDLIVDHAINDRQTLKACSLVSLQWVSRSRLHLFYAVILATTPSIKALIDLLESPLSTITGSVRRLVVEVSASFSSDQTENFAPYLTRLNEMCRIASLGFIQQRDTASDAEIFLSPWSCFDSVQSVSFGQVLASPHLLDFIASFPNLRVLELDGVHWRYWGPELFGHIPAPPPPNLQAVSLGYCATDVVLDWLLRESAEGPSRCSLLDIRSISVSHVVSLAKFLVALGPTLQHLSLSLRLADEGAVQQTLNILP